MLQDHPFPVEAFFRHSLVLTFAVPKEAVLPLLPPCLAPDTYADTYAFVAAAMVETKGLRPKGFPAFLGNDFVLAGYRIFVRYTTSAGKRLRGLYILKSETDKKKMEVLGNIFTHYAYGTTDIAFHRDAEHLTVKSCKSGLDIEVIPGGEETPLPASSPFHDWKEARRFAGPLPFTFTYDADKQEVLIIEGVREHWTPRPVEVIRSEVGFVQQLNLPETVLANAFLIENIPYWWKKGRKDPWQPS